LENNNNNGFGDGLKPFFFTIIELRRPTLQGLVAIRRRHYGYSLLGHGGVTGSCGTGYYITHRAASHHVWPVLEKP
jgi:hypothetical protein